MITPQSLKGFRDHLPAAMSARQYVMDTLRGVFELHGFGALETPALEYAATLEGKYGEDERLMYRFEDQGKRRSGLRFDLTVPLARVVGMHLNELQFPGSDTRSARSGGGITRSSGGIGSSTSAILILWARARCWPMPRRWLFMARRWKSWGSRVQGGDQSQGGAGGAGTERRVCQPEQAGTIFRAVDKLDKIGADGVRGRWSGTGFRRMWRCARSICS